MLPQSAGDGTNEARSPKPLRVGSFVLRSFGHSFVIRASSLRTNTGFVRARFFLGVVKGKVAMHDSKFWRVVAIVGCIGLFYVGDGLHSAGRHGRGTDAW